MPVCVPFTENEAYAYGNGLESGGPSRPPTPHGIGFPDNFAEVVRGIYRSSFPMPVHLSSIRLLGLKTIITLVDEEWSPEYVKFVQEHHITSHIIPILANKNPTVYTPQSTVENVLRILLNPKNHPVLIHCNKGKHRTGCVVACLRKAQGWPMDQVLSEYLEYSRPKARILDRTYIQRFDESVVADLAREVGAEYWFPTITTARSKIDGDDDENYSTGSNGKGKVGDSPDRVLTGTVNFRAGLKTQINHAA
ncbi:hypothetical protein FQN57_006662 [Myotisia sp. PD_48]|nr:hypothetical protein FQN57_006662 [Myotisia sp. PD_48]